MTNEFQPVTIPGRPDIRAQSVLADGTIEYHIHNNALTEGGYVAQGEKEEEAFIEQDFYVNSEGILPPSCVTEADKAQAQRWYGFTFLEQTEQMIGLHAWRISRERQLIAALSELSTARQQLTGAQAEIATLKAQVDRLQAPVSDQEINAFRWGFPEVVQTRFDLIIAARAAEEGK